MTTKRIGSYEILEDKVLGTGSDGVVYLGTCTKSGERVAVKKIDRTLLSHRAREHLAIEIRVLRALNHSNIVQLKDVIYEELGRDIYMVLEYVPGQDLFEYVQSRETPLAQAEAMQIMAQAVSAVGYCHARGIVHHDLCLENMMVRMEANAPLVSSRTKATGSPRIQLIDFGFCEEVQPGKLLERFSGSEPYAAPELFEGDAYEGLPIDVWSLGVILYVLMRGKFPFDPSDMDLHYDQATDPDYLSALLSDFDKNPAEAQVLDLLRRMLDPNPRTRISMPEVQNHAWFDSLSLNSNNTPALTNNNLLEISMRDDLKLGVSDFVSSVLLSNADAVVVSSMDLLRIEADVDRNGNVAGIQAGNEPVLIARVRTYTEAS